MSTHSPSKPNGSPQYKSSFELDGDPLLCTKEAAPLVGRAASTLEKMRVKGNGPQYKRIGGRVLYQRSQLQSWLRAQPDYASTSQYGRRNLSNGGAK